jgi:hypothetical protein
VAGTFLLNGLPANAGSPVQETQAHHWSFEPPAPSLMQTAASVDTGAARLQERPAFMHASRRRLERSPAYALPTQSSQAAVTAAVARPAADQNLATATIRTTTVPTITATAAT